MNSFIEIATFLGTKNYVQKCLWLAIMVKNYFTMGILKTLVFHIKVL